jgi:flavin reductase (DIM6/NTAB) family NADH-FMN oxidoreductase RutF
VPPTAAEFREAVSRFATGITVVTCVVDGVDHAMTANAFASVSLDPVLVLVSVERDARFHDAVSATSGWGVSILSVDAEPVARWLATKGRPLEGQLDQVAHHRSPNLGVALIDGALATLECRTVDTHKAGDHDIVVGEVIALETRPDEPVGEEHASTEPLLYYRRRYRSIASGESSD